MNKTQENRPMIYLVTYVNKKRYTTYWLCVFMCVDRLNHGYRMHQTKRASFHRTFIKAMHMALSLALYQVWINWLWLALGDSIISLSGSSEHLNNLNRLTYAQSEFVSLEYTFHYRIEPKNRLMHSWFQVFGVVHFSLFGLWLKWFDCVWNTLNKWTYDFLQYKCDFDEIKIRWLSEIT